MALLIKAYDQRDFCLEEHTQDAVEILPEESIS